LHNIIIATWQAGLPVENLRKCLLDLSIYIPTNYRISGHDFQPHFHFTTPDYHHRRRLPIPSREFHCRDFGTQRIRRWRCTLTKQLYYIHYTYIYIYSMYIVNAVDMFSRTQLFVCKIVRKNNNTRPKKTKPPLITSRWRQTINYSKNLIVIILSTNACYTYL